MCILRTLYVYYCSYEMFQLLKQISRGVARQFRGDMRHILIGTIIATNVTFEWRVWHRKLGCTVALRSCSVKQSLCKIWVILCSGHYRYEWLIKSPIIPFSKLTKLS